jgi:hypothetical protein
MWADALRNRTAIVIDLAGILALCAFCYFLNLGLTWAYGQLCP